MNGKQLGALTYWLERLQKRENHPHHSDAKLLYSNREYCIRLTVYPPTKVSEKYPDGYNCPIMFMIREYEADGTDSFVVYSQWIGSTRPHEAPQKIRELTEFLIFHGWDAEKIELFQKVGAQ